MCSGSGSVVVIVFVVVTRRGPPIGGRACDSEGRRAHTVGAPAAFFRGRCLGARGRLCRLLSSSLTARGRAGGASLRFSEGGALRRCAAATQRGRLLRVLSKSILDSGAYFLNFAGAGLILSAA